MSSVLGHRTHRCRLPSNSKCCRQPACLLGALCLDAESAVRRKHINLFWICSIVKRFVSRFPWHRGHHLCGDLWGNCPIRRRLSGTAIWAGVPRLLQPRVPVDTNKIRRKNRSPIRVFQSPTIRDVDAGRARRRGRFAVAAKKSVDDLVVVVSALRDIPRI